jgi:hypothetical protein
MAELQGGGAEEAGVEPTEDAGRPPTGLKPARVTGPDTLPHSARCGGSAKQLGAAQDDPRITEAPRHAHFIKKF